VEYQGVKTGLILFLTYVVLGTITSPSWWYSFLFGRGILSNEEWTNGIAWNFQLFSISSIMFLVLLYLDLLLSKKRRLTVFIESVIEGLHVQIVKKHAIIIFVLLALMAMSIVTLDMRTREQREASGELAKKMMDKNYSSKAPLDKPSRFVFLAKTVIDPMFKQHEDSLAIEKVTEEYHSSKEFKGEVKFSEFVKTEGGKNEAQKRIVEYRKEKRSPEQQTAELVGYLYKNNQLKTYGHEPKPRSPSRKYIEKYYKSLDGLIFIDSETKKTDTDEIDEAVKTFKKYGIPLDSAALKKIRSSSLSKQIQDLETDLRSVQGNVLVVGNWSVQSKGDIYNFTRLFIDDVSNSPISEFRLSKTLIVNESKTMIENAINTAKNTTMKLGVFGSVASSSSGQPVKVLIDPIAVYIP
jgi:hypothetical protein